MDAAILIAAYKEEDARLRRLCGIYPLRRRNDVPPGCDRSLTQILGHIAYWDHYAIRFYRQRLAGEQTESLTFEQFLARDAAERQRLESLPYQLAFDAYVDCTEQLLAFLEEAWEEMDEQMRGDFTIPLEHRRHHRKQLERGLNRWLDRDQMRSLMTG